MWGLCQRMVMRKRGAAVAAAAAVDECGDGGGGDGEAYANATPVKQRQSMAIPVHPRRSHRRRKCPFHPNETMRTYFAVAAAAAAAAGGEAPEQSVRQRASSQMSLGLKDD
jgi:hypothetical protein